MVNILSFDVEEWFDNHSIAEDKKKSFQHRADVGVRRVLSILRASGVSATFFVLGRVAQENPNIIKLIDEDGHEIATHGYSHMPLSEMKPATFKNDLLHSINILKKIVNKEIIGFRAPGYSMTDDTLWALDILKECGLKYDSSIYPVSLRMFTRGGATGYPAGAFMIRPGLMEYPLATLNLLGVRFPAATTAYFRIFPYWVSRLAMNQSNSNNIGAVLNFHSWEFDEDHPRFKFPFPQNIKHYYNLGKLCPRFEKLLSEFNFTNFRSMLKQ